MSDPDYIPDEVCLDKCLCGGHPHFATRYHRAHTLLHSAHCLRCGYTTAEYPKQFQAMCEWNTRQRKERGII
jgi:hypothetical protein